MININNKEKQFVGGNWGHPRKFIKKHTEIPNPLIPKEPKIFSSRKYKKKHKWIDYYKLCPFCLNELKEIGTFKKFNLFLSTKYADKCICGAKMIKNGCPCCKNDTWLKDEIYKHKKLSYLNCGFIGRKSG